MFHDLKWNILKHSLGEDYVFFFSQRKEETQPNAHLISETRQQVRVDATVTKDYGIKSRGFCLSQKYARMNRPTFQGYTHTILIQQVHLRHVVGHTTSFLFVEGIQSV